ncbi:MAG: hypothetical protein EAX91_00080 [Candidatus Lokiarchaeota archaeon]|nr:hypothetical protein [Candidatus Lokiarchaeota archaeon]
MKDLLKSIQLSDTALELYLRCVGQAPLSSFELFSILPNISQEDFSNIIKELTEAGLFVPIKLQGSELFLQYLSLPPINPILNYYNNINTNLDVLKGQLQLLISNSLSTIFQENKLVELDSMYKATQDLWKDIEEDVIIQKQDIEDIVQGMENLKVIEKVIENLQQSIKGITQTQFSYLIKLITNIKTDINNQIGYLELKKNEKPVLDAIENVFKENFNKFLKDFTANLHRLIEAEFKNTIESLNNIVNSTFQFRNDFQLVLLNMLNSYEKKINVIIELIKTKRDTLDADLNDFENVIIENFKEIIYHSIDSVAALNNPINNSLESYLKLTTTVGDIDFWDINSVSRANEEIIFNISQSRQKFMVIVPKLEDHIAYDDFKDISKGVKIELASSEPHTNSHVKALKELKNLEFRTLKNDNIMVCKSDDNYLLIGLIRESSQDSLSDFIGFATSNKSVIKLFLSVVNTVWDTATSSLYETPKSLGISPLKESNVVKTSNPISSSHFKVTQTKSKTPVKEEPSFQEVKLSDKFTTVSEKIQKKIEIPSEKVNVAHESIKDKEPIEANEDSSVFIKTAFKTLIQKLHKLNGEEFSEEMEKIADLILEKKGFSVTLHKIRSKINQYKTHLGHLSDVDINHIIESIEEWEKHIL